MSLAMANVLDTHLVLIQSMTEIIQSLTKKQINIIYARQYKLMYALFFDRAVTPWASVFFFIVISERRK